MNCRIGKSTKIQKNGKKRGKQNYRCVQCGRQFITEYERYQGYSEEFKRECLKLYVNVMGFRAIERVKEVHNTTIMAWVREVGELLPSAYDAETIPQVGELDELETFVGQKKTKFGAAAIAASDASTEPIGSKLLRNAGANAPFFERKLVRRR